MYWYPHWGGGVRVQAKLPSVKTRTFSSFYNPRNTLKKSAISCFLAFSFSLGIVAPAFAEVPDVIFIDGGAYALVKKNDGNYYLRQNWFPWKHFSTPFQIDDTKKKITLVKGISEDLRNSSETLREFFRNFDEIHINNHFDRALVDGGGPLTTFRADFSHSNVHVNNSNLLLGMGTTFLHTKDISFENIKFDEYNTGVVGFVDKGDHGVITGNKLSMNFNGQKGFNGVQGYAGMPVCLIDKPSGERYIRYEETEITMWNGGTAVFAGKSLNSSNTLAQKSQISVSLGDTKIVMANVMANGLFKPDFTSYGLRAVGRGEILTRDLSINSSINNAIGISAEVVSDRNDESDAEARVNIKGGHLFINMSGNNTKAIYAGKQGSVLVNKALETRDLNINGDIEAKDGGKIILNALTQKSSIIAKTEVSSGGAIELGLGNGASWHVKGDSHVSSLSALGDNSHVYLSEPQLGENSHVYLTQENDKRKTLVIDELKGKFQLTFVLHTDLKGKNEVGANDRVIIKSADSGSHALYIPSSGEPENGAESSYLVYAPDSVNIQLNEKYHTNQLVDKGLYLYKLTSEKVAVPEEAASLTREAPSYNGHYLILATENPSDPGNTDNPGDSGNTDNPGDSGKPVIPLLSPTAKAVLAMAGMGGQNAMYHNQLSDLRKRLGEVRGMTESNGLWVSASGQRDRFDGFASNGVKQNAYRFNLGLDHKIGSWLVGANFKYLHGTQKTSNPDSHAKGKVNSAGANIYGTWIAENGLYTDIVASFDHYHQKITTSMLDGRGVSGKVNNFGLGLSAEVGKKFGLTKDFFVEPQAQLAYYWIKGKDFSMSNGMKVEQDDFNSLVGRLGVVAGKDFKDAEGNTKGQVFVKGGVKQQFAGKQKLRANSVQFKDELKGTSGYYGLGFEANPNKKVSLYGHVERENGKHYTKEIEVMLGLRYKF